MWVETWSATDNLNIIKFCDSRLQDQSDLNQTLERTYHQARDSRLELLCIVRILGDLSHWTE